MVTETALTCTRATTRAMSTPTPESASCLLALATNSCCAQSAATLALSGASSLTTASTSAPAGHKRESTARSSETRASTYRHRSWSQRMQSLISSGLIAGITPTSIAKRSVQVTLGFASSQPGGADAAGQQVVCSCLSEQPEPHKCRWPECACSRRVCGPNDHDQRRSASAGLTSSADGADVKG